MLRRLVILSHGQAQQHTALLIALLPTGTGFAFGCVHMLSVHLLPPALLGGGESIRVSWGVLEYHENACGVITVEFKIKVDQGHARIGLQQRKQSFDLH